MSNILVTGGAGFIGSHTVVELHNEGYEPVIIDNFSNSEKSVVDNIQSIIGKPIPLYEEDCSDEQVVKKIIGKEKISGIIHFAAYKAVGESVKEPLKYYKNNLGSQITLLRVMKEMGIKDFVFSSSCTVYGEPDNLPVTEESPIKPAESPYGNTKQICEEILGDETRSGTPMKGISLRYFNPIGAHPTARIGELPIGTPNNLVPFITQTAAGLQASLTIFGNDYNTPDGTCIRDYIHVVDLAKAHIAALRFIEDRPENTYYDVFNLGTGKGHSVKEVVTTFEKVNDVKLNYKVGPRREGDVEQIWANADKANRIFNWKAELSLAHALEDAWRWQQRLANR